MSSEKLIHNRICTDNLYSKVCMNFVLQQHNILLHFMISLLPVNYLNLDLFLGTTWDNHFQIKEKSYGAREDCQVEKYPKCCFHIALFTQIPRIFVNFVNVILNNSTLNIQI